MIKDKIGQLLSERKQNARWLAEQLGMDNTTLWRKMNNKSEWKKSDLMAMALLFDVPVEYFTEA